MSPPTRSTVPNISPGSCSFSHSNFAPICSFGALRLFYACPRPVRRIRACFRSGFHCRLLRIHIGFAVCAGLAIVTGASAVVGLRVGCSLMVHETNMAVKSLTEESKLRIAMRGMRPPR